MKFNSVINQTDARSWGAVQKSVIQLVLKRFLWLRIYAHVRAAPSEESDVQIWMKLVCR